jgi:hypothetical protein
MDYLLEQLNTMARIYICERRFNASFSSLFSKDVRLPVQLQRAMAAEAEAAREARAKVGKEGGSKRTLGSDSLH